MMARTMLIGLDGATFSILDPLMENGTMPFLKSLVANGARGELLSTSNPLTPQAWTSLMTGRSPGHHGILDFVKFQEREHGPYLTITDSRDLRCETIWSIATRNNRTVTSLNFYGMFPPQPVNGYTISGFVPWRHLKDATYPPDLYESLKKLPTFDSRQLAMDLDSEKKCIQGMPDEQYEDWIKLHIRRERRWFEILEYLASTDPTDLTAIVFDGVDKIQHLCWRFIDERLFPAAPTAWERKIQDLCLAYFRQIDNFISRIVDLAGPDARVLLASDHGFGTSTEIFYVNVWLQQHGYLKWTDETAQDEAERLTADRLKSHISLIDWSQTKAYAVSPSSNGIFIRRKEQHNGCGIPDSEYESFRGQLCESLSAFTDPATGVPIVSGITPREVAYPGSEMNLAPDLLLTLRDGGFVSILNADTPLKQRSQPAGTHRPEGIFIAAGNGIQRGQTGLQFSILDIAPTLLYSLGLTIPQSLEGATLTSIFEPSFLQSHPICIDGMEYSAGRTNEPSHQTAEKDMGQDEIAEKLKLLGYLE
jgi:predicted AlkP superfamily phosphohydrolase/phosphomutase